MTQKVSIIVPCYNGERFVDQCLESIYTQDYPCVELIIVDDGSTDHSHGRIIAWNTRFKEKGYELKYVFQQNQGLGGAINTGLKFVTGNYLTLLDVDDIFLNGSISERARFLAAHPDYNAVRTNGWIIKGENRRLFVSDDEEKKISDVFTALVHGKTNNWAGSYMVRTDILFSFYPNREMYISRFGQNLQILLPVTYHAKCGFIDQPLMCYIQQPDSLSQASRPKVRAQKNLKNHQGYHDIRVHMIKAIVSNPNEQEPLIQYVDAAFYRFAMENALWSHNKKQMHQYYHKLAEISPLELNDMICYYRLINAAVAVPLRAIRKVIYFCKKRIVH